MNYFVVKKSAKGHSWNLPLIKGGGVGEEGRTFQKLSHLGGGVYQKFLRFYYFAVQLH